MDLRQYSDAKLSVILFFSAALWGLYWLPLHEIEKAGVQGPWSVVLFNFCPLLVLYPLLIYRGDWRGVNFQTAFIAAFFAGVGIALYAVGLIATTVVRATLLFYLTPIWSTLIGVVWLSEKLTMGRVVAIVLGLVGLGFLLYKTNASPHPLNIGDACGLASGMFWAVGAAAIKRWPDTPVLTLATLQVTVTMICATTVGLLLFDFPAPDFASVQTAFPVAFITSVLILIPTALFVFAIAKILFPGRVGVLMMSEVIVAIISAAILLPDERLSMLQWIGAIAIVSAALIEIAAGEAEEG